MGMLWGAHVGIFAPYKLPIDKFTTQKYFFCVKCTLRELSLKYLHFYPWVNFPRVFDNPMWCHTCKVRECVDGIEINLPLKNVNWQIRSSKMFFYIRYTLRKLTLKYLHIYPKFYNYPFSLKTKFILLITTL